MVVAALGWAVFALSQRALTRERSALATTTPETLHRGPFERALEAGCSVPVEKPFTMTLDDARAMRQAAAAHRAVTAICFNLRYAPGFQATVAEVRAGRVGRLRAIETAWPLAGDAADVSGAVAVHA